jgi:hypothetical protein
MKKLYFLFLLFAFSVKSFSQINCITIRGDRTSSKFRQLLLDSNGPYAADSSQPEIVAGAWTCSSGGYPSCNFRGLFRYDVSSVPANAVITSAKLYLYAKTNAINGYYGMPTYGSANTSLLQKVIAQWNMAGTGWANQPAAATANQKTLAQSTSTAQNYVVDVTDFVQSWVNSPDSNYGMLLRLQAENSYNSLIFNSGSATDSTLRPTLEICYKVTPPPPACTNSLVIKGNPYSGQFQQALMGTWNPVGADTTQPEIVAGAWTCVGGGFSTCNFRSMLRYDVRSIPVNAVISSAKLYLYAKTNNINGNYGNPTYGSANTALLQKAISPWNNVTVGWNNQPSVSTVSQKVLPQSTSTQQNYVADITDFVQSWVNKPDSNYGMMLRLLAEQYYNSMVFNSGQAADSLRPRLEICYSLTAPDSCKADFKDSTWSDNSASHLLTAVPGNNNNKKPVQVCWTFGDGKDTCINYNPGNQFNYYSISHTYKTAGTYNACVKITYEGGCVAQKCKSITVVLPPVNPVCNNSLVIKGNRTDGKFKQIFLDSNGPYGTDTTQPELGAAAWTCYGGGYSTCNFRSAFRYDVSSIPANAVITNARLYLYAKTNNINGYYGAPTYGTANTSLLQKVIVNWKVAGTGWLNQPAATTAGQKTLAQSTSTAQNYAVDVTDFVQSWVNKPDSNYGMLLRLQAEQYYNSMIFNSGQASDSLKPRLEICYTIPTPGADSCRANFTDSIADNNPLKKLFIAAPWHSANKKPIQICWNFGDGKDTCFNYSSTNTNYSITHTYSKYGNYNICVTIKYDGGCVSTRCRAITVYGTPNTTPTCADSKQLIVKGDGTGGKFKQLFLDSNVPNAADTAQPEIGAAAWTCNSGGYPTCNFRSLFRYELSSLPTNTRITSAKLYLYAKTNNINGLYGSPTYGSNNTGLLQQVTAPWTIGGTGWSNQPATTIEREKQLSRSSSTAQNYEVDVTDFVQTWVKHPEQNNGMLLRLQSEQYYNSLIFNSGQAPDSLKPRLEICYQIVDADSNKVEVKLYPNPTTGPLLAWVFTSDAQKGSASLYDLRGNLKQVLRSSINYYAGVNVVTFNVNRLGVPAGYYYVKIWVGGTVQTFKVMLL